MRIAVLSNPDNFHTRKWVSALISAGADVSVFSYDLCSHDEFPAIRLPLPDSCKGKLSYRAYLHGGGILNEALEREKIDCVVALNVTPFGVWAMKSGFQPWVAVAMGADILEFLPKKLAPRGLHGRSWDNIEGQKSGFSSWKAAITRPVFRYYVGKALRSARHVTADNQPLIDGIVKGFGILSEKVTLNRWGLEPEKFTFDPDLSGALRKRLGIPENHKVILSPRGLKAFYQADVIAEAYLNLVESGQKDCSLVMLGAGYPASMKTHDWSLRSQQSGGNLLVIEQVLNPDEMAQLWLMTDIFISAPIYDGYSSSVAEGRFAGSIPVVNSIPGNLEIIQHGENGWMCNPFNPKQLSDDLAYLLKHSQELKCRFADKNQDWIRKHGLLAPNAQAFMSLLEKLIR